MGLVWESLYVEGWSRVRKNKPSRKRNRMPCSRDHFCLQRKTENLRRTHLGVYLMLVQKKHAMAIADMFTFMAFEGYYPLSPGEEGLIGRCLSFAVYHDLADQKELEATVGYGDIKIKKTARLDLTGDNICAIISVYKEVCSDPNLEEGGLDGVPAAVKYLEKTFAK